jgi:hypothetical protein
MRGKVAEVDINTTMPKPKTLQINESGMEKLMNRNSARGPDVQRIAVNLGGVNDVAEEFEEVDSQANLPSYMRSTKNWQRKRDAPPD